MSEVLAPPPGLTPEELAEYVRAEQRQAQIALTGAGSSAISNLAPDPTLPGPLKYVPGTTLAENVIGMAGGLTNAADDAARWGLGKIGLGGLIPPAPKFSGTAGKHAAETTEQIYKQLGGPEPENEGEQFTKGGSESLGMALPLGPEASFAKFLPSFSHLPVSLPAMGTLGTAGEAVQAAEEAPPKDQAPAAPPSYATFMGQLAQTPTQDQTAPGSVQVAENVKAGTATDAPSSYASYMSPPPDQTGSYAQYLQPGAMEPPVAPTFAGAGYTDRTIGGDLLAIAGVAVGVAAAAFTHRIGAAATEAGRYARFNNPDYTAKAQAYNDSVIARGNLGSASAPAVEPPLAEANLPGGLGTNRFRQATNYANTQLLDANAQIMDAIRMNADPTVADRIAHAYGLYNTEAASNVKTKAFLQTGFDPVSQITIPSMNDLNFKWTKLSDGQKVLWDETKQFMDEQNNRTNNRNDKVPEDNVRHNFKQYDDAQLQERIDQGKADPAIADMVQHSKDMTAGMIDIGIARGYFTRVEGERLIARHPDYVPEADASGKIMHTIGTREAGSFTGVDQINARAHDVLSQHTEALYKDFDQNDLKSMLWKSVKDTMAAHPDSAQFMQEVARPKGADAPDYFSGVGGAVREHIVQVRTDQGPVYLRVDHPDYLNAMTGDSLLRSRVMSNAITIPRRLYQRFVTGPAAAIGGKFYAITTPVYTGLSMAANAPRDMYGGMLDRTVQRTLGKSSGSILARSASTVARGLDVIPNVAIGIPKTYAQGVGHRWMERMADWTRKEATNPVNRLLRAYNTDAQVDLMSQAMRDRYMKTSTARAAQRGIGGLGQPIVSDLPALRMESEKRPRTLSASEVPDAFIDGKFAGTKSFGIKLANAINEAFTHIGDAGHQYFHDLNEDNPNVSKEGLAYETRHLTGDPGTQGKFMGVRGLSAVDPFLNVTVQGVARVGRSLGERPFAAPISAAIGMGSLAMLTILTHMRSKEHLDYLENQVSAQQLESNLILATSSDPHRPTMIPLPQEFRPVYAWMLESLSKLINIVAANRDPVTANKVVEMLKDWFGSHITHVGAMAQQHAVADVLPSLLPPQAGQIDTNKLLQGHNLVDSYRPPTQGHALNLPNQVGDGLLDDKDGRIYQGLLSSFFGAVGSAFETVNSAVRYAHQTGSWVDGIGMAGHDWLQGMKDKNPQLNVIWDNQVRASVSPPIVEKTNEQLSWLDKIGGLRAAERGEGFTSATRFAQPVPMSTTEKLPKDPTMLQMWQVAEAYKTRLAPMRDEITNIKQQMGSVQARGLDPDRKRQWMNDRTRDVADKSRHIDTTLADLNYALSKLAGTPMTIRRFANGDMQGTAAQFR